MYRPPGEPSDFNLDNILSGVGGTINRFTQRLGAGGSGAIILIAILLVVIIWFGSGVYSVGPSEQGALRLFGRYTGTVEPGLHWYWPRPIGKRNVEAVRQTRRMDLGFLTRGSQSVDVPAEALMITGDLNIIDIQLAVQYRISDLEKFLFRVDDPGEGPRGIVPGRPEGITLKEATEAALRQVVGQRSIDDVLTVGRDDVQAETQLLLQSILDDYEAGIQILEVRLENVRPPDQVRDAFDDVVRARVDKESFINQANSYREDQIPRALGRAAQVTQSAEAFKAERIAKADGEAQRFISVLFEYEQSREVTRKRLYLEAIETILPSVKKFILDPDSGSGILPLLNLGDQTAPLPIFPEFSNPPPQEEAEQDQGGDQ